MALLTKIAGGCLTLRCRVAWLVGLALLGAVAPGASAQTTTSAEYQLKAAFLYKLAQFVQWPARAFRDAQAPLVIGILGEDPFGAYLDESIVRGEKIDEHPLVVRRYKRVDDAVEGHLLFISSANPAELEKIFAQLKGRAILTVGDADTFTRLGGMVRFVVEEGHVRLRISVEAAKACDLKISSKILSPTTIVAPGKD
jgi:hypothetical protein